MEHADFLFLFFFFFNVPGIAAWGVFSNRGEKKREAVKEEKRALMSAGSSPNLKEVKTDAHMM